MIGIVLITHGNIAEALTTALELIIGKQSQWATIAIEPQDNPTSRKADVAHALREVDSGQGAVLLTDMFGGTPSNLAIAAMTGRSVEVLAGVNLPMLIKLAEVRGKVPLHQAVLEAQDAARKYIHVAGNLLKESA